MFRIGFKISFGLIVLLSLFSCSQKTDCDNTYTCLGILFRGYDSLALKEVIVSEYSKDGNFSQSFRRDTLLIDNSPQPLHVYDSTTAAIEWPFTARLYPGSDWQIDLPYAGRRYRISGIERSDNQVKVFGELHESDWCSNVITSYYLDGIKIVTGHSASGFTTSSAETATLRR